MGAVCKGRGRNPEDELRRTLAEALPDTARFWFLRGTKLGLAARSMDLHISIHIRD